MPETYGPDDIFRLVAENARLTEELQDCQSRAITQRGELRAEIERLRAAPRKNEQAIAKAIYDRIAGGEFILQDAALETAGECATAIIAIFEQNSGDQS